MKIYNVLEAKSNLSRLIAAVESGREAEIVIARNGRPVARLSPFVKSANGPRLGVAKGLFEPPDDIDAVNGEVGRLFGAPDSNLLLDTHVALWAIADSPRLPKAARDLLTRPDNRLWVSAVSLWEIAIKNSLARRGLGAMPLTAAAALGYFKSSGYSLLAVTPDHAAAVERLAPLHADPFDRLLIAQALEEPLRLLTHDAAVGAYDPSVIVF